MLAGPGGLDGGIECKEIGLVGDVINDADALGDFLHRHHRLLYRFAALGGFLGGLAGHAIGDLGVFGVLVDAGAHLLHRRTGFLDAGGLFTGGLAHRLRGGADLLGGAGQVIGGIAHFTDDMCQLADHVAHGVEHHAGFIFATGLDMGVEVAFGQLLGGARGLAQRAGNDPCDEYRQAQADQQGRDQYRDD